MAHDLHVALPPEPTSAGRARRVTGNALAGWGMDDLVDSAQLAVSELVTNALLHGRTPVDLRIEQTSDGVRIGVTDGSSASPVARDYGELAATGRGLHLVAQVAHDFGVETHGESGKTVWFELTRAALETAGAPGDWSTPGPADSPGDAVVLRGLPVRLWSAAQQHHDAMLREVLLHHHEAAAGMPRSDLAEAERAEACLAAAVEGAVSSVSVEDPDTVDVHLVVAAHHVREFAALQDVLDDAEKLATKGELLALPALPEVVALRDWCCEQVLAQVQGVGPAPWSHDRAPHRGGLGEVRVEVSRPVWDDAWVRNSVDFVVAADDHNRILAVSVPASRLFGWDADELVGRRVVTLIPERLREAHVAGFTRHLTTGETRLIGHPSVVPVLRGDGTETACVLHLEKARADGARRVFVARFEPVTD